VSRDLVRKLRGVAGPKNSRDGST